MAIPLTLKVFKGDALVATKEYERDIIKIGRLASAHLCLDDEKVSRIHSVIEVGSDGKLSIIDMGSMEGTFVNGKRVNKGPLAMGDEIRVGQTRIVVESKTERTAVPLQTGTPSIVVNQQHMETSGTSPTAPHAVAEAPPAPAPVQARPPAPPPASVPSVVVAAAPVIVAAAPPPPAIVEAPPMSPSVGRVVMTPANPKAVAASARPGRSKSDLTGEVGLQIRFVWGDFVLSIHQLEKPKGFWLGTSARCQVPLDETKLGSEEFELMNPQGGDFVIHIPRGAVGEIDDGSGPVQLKESKRVSGGDVTLSAKDFLWFDIGGLRAEMAFVPMPKKVFVPLAERLDFRFLNLLLLVLVMAGGFVISAKNLSFDDDTMADDLLKRPAVVAKFLLKEEQKQKNPLLDKLKLDKEKNQGEAAAKHSGEEGKMGRKDQNKDTHQRSGVKAIDPNAKDRAKAQLLSLFGGRGGGIQTIFGNGGLGGNLKNAVGNMFGNQVGDSQGLGGLGLKGAGGGGGGMGNTVGIGAIGTHGRGGGFGAYGNGVGGLSGKKDVDIGISNDNAIVQGSLDKELIRQVIHRNSQQIRYCYETQLVRFPKLGGKVAIQFVISGEGTVAMAKVAQSTVNNPELEQCIASRFKSWLFPKPKGGGIVQVTYPVVLKQSGE